MSKNLIRRPMPVTVQFVFGNAEGVQTIWEMYSTYLPDGTRDHMKIVPLFPPPPPCFRLDLSSDFGQRLTEAAEVALAIELRGILNGNDPSVPELYYLH